ncbi:long-chain fatty acid--CoA ligase [Alphaproteobacteria bacterium]|nr:long-chain fatty acid--CoA ligase [Alphaproteobacteria bacterium]
MSATTKKAEVSRYVTKANLASAFFENAAVLGDKPLLFHKSKGKWTGKSWDEVADSVRRLAGALVAAGIKPRDRVLISAENRPEWAIADLAVMSIGAIVVPAYTTNTEDDHVYIMEHSGALIAITSGGLLASRVALAASRVQHMRMLITMDPDTKLPNLGERTVYRWQDLLTETEPLANIDSRIAAQDSDDTCCFVYTSGTGGRPKGVMLTHRSIQACINASIEILNEGGVGENQRFLSLLPLSHSYEHTAGMHLPIQTKSEVWYCESAEQIGANLQEVSPSLMTAVPRLYDVLHERIMRSIRTKGGFSETLFMETIRLGRKRLEGRTLLPHEFFLDLFLEKLIRQKIQVRLGGKLKYFISGGAALNPEIGSFFMALGVKLLQGYGQTEASPVISANRPGKIKIETVGPPVAGVEVRFADDGEILVRGDLLMKGYWRDDHSTAATIRDGWLYTGDLGSCDDDGYITITGRKKEIIVNSGGENIVPSRVEALLTIEPEIEQALVDGDRRPWLAAVIVPSAEARAAAVSDEALELLIAETVERANSRLSQIERVRRFIIADEGFTIKNSQLTATLKVRRHVVRAQYQDRLAALYARGKQD